MTVEKLNHILSDHLLWLNDPDTGKCADFSGWNLSGFDLSWANLARAILTDANLSGANLSHADLSGANLKGAELAGANLTGANLEGAQYEIAELEKADFGSKPVPRKEKPEVEIPEAEEEVKTSAPVSSSEVPTDGAIPVEEESSESPDEDEDEVGSEPPETETDQIPASPPKLSPPSMTRAGGMTPPPAPPAPAEQSIPAPVQPSAPAPAAPAQSGGLFPPGGSPDSGNAADRSPAPSSAPRRKGRSPFSAIGSAISGMFKKENQEVAVSSFVPGKIVREEPFTIQCWVHWESAREEVQKRAASSGHASEAGAKSGLVIEKGALVELSITPVSLIDVAGQRNPQTRTIRWEGFPTDEEFVFAWPADGPDVIYETVEISVEGIPLGDCTLCLRLDHDNPENVISEFKRIRRAFVSYAHGDSQRVFASVQAFQTVTNVDLFLDVDDLRAGVDWEKKLRSEVSSRDALFLYWSEHAAQSEWVNREWRLALAERGIGYIKPMPLDPLPPPEELAQLQFADKWARLAEYQRLKESAG